MSYQRSSWALLLAAMGVSPLAAAAAPPDYMKSVLESVYPAGGQRGQSVRVQFGTAPGGAAGVNKVIVDGARGITVRDVKPGKNVVSATLVIADDAPVGRRMVRLAGGPCGLTNFRWFVVGRQREFIEKERNETADKANKVKTPVVINGRVQRPVDRDCFRFQGKKGQKIVAAINAHGLDAMGYGRDDQGFVDTSLELLDQTGRVVASAEDSIGFDPNIHTTLPADGWYTARVTGLGYRGFPQAVYRLTLGDVGYVTSVFPAGGQRGRKVPLQLSGLNLPTDAQLSLAVSKRQQQTVEYVAANDERMVAHDLAFVRGDLPESIETESNNDQRHADSLTLNSTVNGRFHQDNDEDWYRLNLKKGQWVELEITAQRYLRSPVDTRLEVFDAAGKRIEMNDDGAIFDGMTTHDIRTFDSFLGFVARKSGNYFVRLTEQTGTFGPLAVYRLTCRKQQPDFRLFQWPDAVPVWGAGGTGSFAVDVIRTGRLKADIEISVDGLPEGWKGSTTVSPYETYRGPRRWNLGTRVLLTIDAPPDAKVGDMVTFRVIGRAISNGRVIKHQAQPLTLLTWGSHHFRVSPTTRAVVAPPQGMLLQTKARQLAAEPGQTVKVPVAVTHLSGNAAAFNLITNAGRAHVKCNVGAPAKYQAGRSSVTVPITVPDGTPPGPFDVVIAQQWRSDIRIGLPGPCTSLIRIDVRPKTPADKKDR